MSRKKPHPKWFNRWMFARERRRARFDAVRKRDGDDCWHCGNPLRFGPPYNVGKSATIEHWLPKAMGGTSALGNLRLCHVGCNRHLGANNPEQKERMRLRRES
jgi:5-methylcytosine-specific restriction endonuclease McrA